MRCNVRLKSVTRLCSSSNVGVGIQRRLQCGCVRSTQWRWRRVLSHYGRGSRAIFTSVRSGGSQVGCLVFHFEVVFLCCGCYHLLRWWDTRVYPCYRAMAANDWAEPLHFRPYVNKIQTQVRIKCPNSFNDVFFLNICTLRPGCEQLWSNTSGNRDAAQTIQ